MIRTDSYTTRSATCVRVIDEPTGTSVEICVPRKLHDKAKELAEATLRAALCLLRPSTESYHSDVVS